MEIEVQWQAASEVAETAIVDCLISKVVVESMDSTISVDLSLEESREGDIDAGGIGVPKCKKVVGESWAGGRWESEGEVG